MFREILIILLVRFDHSLGIMNELAIDINDIMSEKLMPASFFVIEGSNSIDNATTTGNLFNNITSVLLPKNDGNFQSAYDSMRFHRDMMSSYMCNNFLAKQILHDVAPMTQFQHRLGAANDQKSVHSLRNDISDAMLYDQGSRGYKDWLTKTSTLDDIFRHIKANGSAGVDFIKSPPFRRIDTGSASSQSDENDGEYEEGTVSGYAVQHAMPSGFVRPRPDNHQNDPQYSTNNNHANHQPEQQYVQNNNYQPEPQYVQYQHEQDTAAPMPPLQTQTVAGNKAVQPIYSTPAGPLFSPVENENETENDNNNDNGNENDENEQPQYQDEQFQWQQNGQLVPVPVPVPVPYAVQVPRPMPIRQWISKFLAKHFKKHIPPQLLQKFLPTILPKILPYILPYIPPELLLQIPPEYLLQIPPDYLLQNPSGYPLQLSPELLMGFLQDFPQGLPYGIPQGFPQGIPQGFPQGFPQGIPQGIPQGFPQGIPQEDPQGEPQEDPQGEPQGDPQESPQAFSQGLPQGSPHGLPQRSPHVLSQGYPQGLPQGIPLGFPQGFPPGFTHGFPSSIYQSYPQAILPYLAPNAMEMAAMNETEMKKFKFWRPFSGIRDKFKKFFSRFKKDKDKNQNQGWDQGYEEWGVMNEGGSGGGGKKEMTLRNIYDIALTAIAYLSFGLFVLQVIMCITLTKTHAGMSMMPMTMETDVMEEMEGAEITEVRRRKRSTSSSMLSELNELSRRVLRSIDAGIVAELDNGKCLQKVLCENNKYARSRKDNQKIWMPIWGLGMSWLSSRMISTPAMSAAVLDCLKASTIGLGNGNCDDAFSCDAKMLKHQKKLHRRKRSLDASYVFRWNI